MSGRQHHHIPQFLQRGFLDASNPKKKICVYYKDRFFYNSVSKVGQERDFYTEGDNDADFIITKYEQKAEKIIRALRENRLDELRSKDVAELIAHFEARSRHLRLNFMKSSKVLVTALVAELSKPDVLEKQLRKSVYEDPTFFEEQLDNMKVPLSIRPRVMELAKSEFENRIEEIKLQSLNVLKRMDDEFFILFRNSFKRGHVNLFKEHPFSEKRVARYSSLNYQVRFFEDVQLMLGDSMVFFKVDGKREFKPFVDRDDVLEAVFLPLASNAILVGSPVDFGFDVNSIKVEIAKTSLEYFIASTDNYENKVLSQEIGKNSHIMLDEELEAIAKSFF